MLPWVVCIGGWPALFSNSQPNFQAMLVAVPQRSLRRSLPRGLRCPRRQSITMYTLPLLHSRPRNRSALGRFSPSRKPPTLSAAGIHRAAALPVLSCIKTACCKSVHIFHSRGNCLSRKVLTTLEICSLTATKRPAAPRDRRARLGTLGAPSR